MNISPQLIPHSDFHKYRWLQSIERPSWYYFKKQKPNSSIYNKDFLNTVDEALRPLVNFLQKKGIKTTPSCSGHHIAERDLEKIYMNLEKDALIIKNKGLNLKDVENGNLEHFKDQSFTLPWVKEDFIKQISEYQHKGVLGFRLKDADLRKNLFNLEISGARITEEDDTLFFFTNENNGYDIREIWTKITENVIMMFKERKDLEL